MLTPFFDKGSGEMNVLKSHLRITVQTLLANGASQREIERMTGVDRKTIRRIRRGIAEANSPWVATGSGGQESGVGAEQIPPPRPPEQATPAARARGPDDMVAPGRRHRARQLRVPKCLLVTFPARDRHPPACGARECQGTSPDSES